MRLLVDDGDTVDGDEEIVALSAHPKIEVRVFNPFVYRGHVELFRAVEFSLTASRRLTTGCTTSCWSLTTRSPSSADANIGDQYFQVDPQSQFGDDDVFAAGPIAKQLSSTFDEFWNSGSRSRRRCSR